MHSVLYKTVCGISNDWSLHARNDAIVIRSGSPVVIPTIQLPPIPDVILNDKEPHCDFKR
jgi:hypothetical protein